MFIDQYVVGVCGFPVMQRPVSSAISAMMNELAYEINLPFTEKKFSSKKDWYVWSTGIENNSKKWFNFLFQFYKSGEKFSINEN